MSSEYRNNHYVPQWYQRRFIPPDQVDQELYYLDLQPGTFVDGRGKRHPQKALRRTGPRKCFVEQDLYTARFGETESRELERIFFGGIDNRGKSAVEFFARYAHDRMAERALPDMLSYLSTQKLRTPKGLDRLVAQTGSLSHRDVLRSLVDLRDMYSAIWAECVWQIADARDTKTKFIVTDHPVTVYNRVCGPRNVQWCRGSNDPDIRLHASHTIFPLGYDQILILTNQSWATNPYREPMAYRANPDLFRGAMFNFLDIQVMRQLTELEVLQINFILKSRAYRYIAAGREDWLFPERHVSKADWTTYGDGYLLMPDPRPLIQGSEYTVGYGDGSTSSLDSQGRRPGHRDFGRESRSREAISALSAFQGEFARRYGPVRRGRSCEGGRLDSERDTDQMHAYYTSLGGRGHS